MKDKKLRFSLKDKLNPYDTETQTYGCRAYNPDICKNNSTPNICAFVNEDNICRSPSKKWKNYYNLLKEAEQND